MMKKLFLLGWIAMLLPLAAQAELPQNNGSLLNLAGDRKALKVGDVLHVQVVETSAAAASADTATNKSGGIGLGVKTPHTIGEKKFSANLNSEFAGAGRIQRSGKVLAQLSVVVTGVDENGLLTVSGQQLIEINGEKQEIELAGRVRPEDVSGGNTIISSRIADARIKYVGDGVLAEQQRPGLLTRIFSWLFLL